MGFLKNAFNKLLPASSNVINIDDSLGNVLVAGNSPTGKDLVFRNMMLSYYQTCGCIILKNASNGFSAIPNMTNSFTMVYGIDTSDGAFTEQFNPFFYLNEKQTTELLFRLLNHYVQFEGATKMKFKEYLSKLVFFLGMAGKKVKLNELGQYTLETLEDMNDRSNLPEFEKKKNERLFDGLRMDIGVLESYFSEFENNNIGFILSGNQSLEDIVKSGKVIEISLDFSSGREEAVSFLSIITDCLSHFEFSKTSVSSLAIAIDGIPNDILLETGFDKFVTSVDRANFIYSIQDISNLAEKTNVFIDKADSIFFFQQNSNKNKEYCSEFFGTFEKQKVSTTQTQGKNRASMWDYLNSRGQTSYNTQTSQTVSTEKERTYLPDVFGNLPQNECIYYFRSNRQHGRLKVY